MRKHVCAPSLVGAHLLELEGGIMPKSKRNRVYTLSQTRKKGREMKSELLQEIRDCTDKYQHIFLFNVENMRNSKLKEVRSQWKSSRFFFGKNRVLQAALGRTEAEEYREGLAGLAKLLRGNVGLFFTNQPRDEVISWFQSYLEQDHARAGCQATDDVILQEGPLEQFPHSMEPHLRKLGLPTVLKKGVVTLIKEHTVCSDGDTLTPEQARLLKLLDWKMAEFRIQFQAVWSQNGQLELLVPEAEGTQSGQCDV
jgi:mRNA turnover protein 4